VNLSHGVVHLGHELPDRPTKISPCRVSRNSFSSSVGFSRIIRAAPARARCVHRVATRRIGPRIRQVHRREQVAGLVSPSRLFDQLRADVQQ
jgi:hypothetical protein